MNDDYKLFLTAQWRWIAMLNYEIEPSVLAPFVPAGTELDLWNGKTYVSMVGFLFRDARVRGLSIPFHRHFEEVNLRFYVRRYCEAEPDGKWRCHRRGVVFIKELVPRAAIAFIARTFYNENYLRLPMSHQIIPLRARLRRTGDNDTVAPEGGNSDGTSAPASVRYSWRFKDRDNFLSVTTRGKRQLPAEGSLEEFIAEHYWGYVKQRDGSTKEYRVEHPKWHIWETGSAEFHCDIASLYGKQFCDFFARPPSSAFLADGSEVKLYNGVRLAG